MTNVIDYEETVVNCNHKTDLAEELLTIFNQNIPEHKKSLEEHLENTQELGNILHQMRGSCAYITMPLIESQVKMLEQQIKQTQAITLTDLKPLFQLMDQAQVQIQQLIK